MEFFEDSRLELYISRNDLSEKNNLAQKMPEKVRELHEQLVVWRKSVNAPMPTRNDPSKAASKADAVKGKGKGKAGKKAKKTESKDCSDANVSIAQ